jgi:hypothetical protein
VPGPGVQNWNISLLAITYKRVHSQCIPLLKNRSEHYKSVKVVVTGYKMTQQINNRLVITETLDLGFCKSCCIHEKPTAFLKKYNVCATFLDCELSVVI